MARTKKAPSYKTLVRRLEEVAQALGVKVRYDTGAFRGGLCTVGEQTYVVLNRRHLPEAHFAILAESLAQYDTDSVFLRPALRSALDQALASQHARAEEAAQAEPTAAS
jgi:hypothetical protein